MHLAYPLISSYLTQNAVKFCCACIYYHDARIIWGAQTFAETGQIQFTK